MAKKKNIEENIVDTQEVRQEDVVLKTNTVSSEVQEEVQDDVQKKQEEDKKEEVTEEATEYPESVKNILRIYSNYPALYIDSKGGVYPEGTQPNWVADTILYQNPYCKS